MKVTNLPNGRIMSFKIVHPLATAKGQQVLVQDVLQGLQAQGIAPTPPVEELVRTGVRAELVRRGMLREQTTTAGSQEAPVKAQGLKLEALVQATVQAALARMRIAADD